jgi:hypothetical protein
MLSLCTHWIEGEEEDTHQDLQLKRFNLTNHKYRFNYFKTTLTAITTLLLLANMSLSTGTRITRQIPLPQKSIGSRSHLLVHSYGPSTTTATTTIGNDSDMSLRNDLIGEENKYSYPESDMAKPRLEKVYIQASLHADELPGNVH